MSVLLIECPKGYDEERSYVFNVIFTDFLGIPYECRQMTGSETKIRLLGSLGEEVICWPDVLFQTSKEKWCTVSSLPHTPLPTWNVAQDLPEAKVVKSVLPVIYGEPLDDQRWFEHSGQEIRLGLDIAGSIFFMLTRYEELVLSDRDEHGRFPAKASLAYRENFLDRPIVDEYVEILWACIKRLWPNLERKKQMYWVWLSHDVDEPLAIVGRPWHKVFRSVMGDLIKRQSIDLAIQRLVARATGNYERDPYNTFAFIMDLSERYGLKSTFFFKAGCTNPRFDANYSIDNPWVQKLMRTIHERGHEIGLHPSYESYNRYEVMRAEYRKLVQSVEQLGIFQEQWGSRQHFLRWENPITWQILDEVGLDYDATLGFADHVGFRCGTCREFPVFNLRTRQTLRLRERPLIAMDTTLLSHRYMKLQAEEVLEQIRALSTTCRDYSGIFSLLWHNTSLAQSVQKKLFLNIMEIISF
ncbi:MAG: polysaccharide deacetylase family protein [Candidatus Bathyarchaeia archaeon]